VLVISAADTLSDTELESCFTAAFEKHQLKGMAPRGQEDTTKTLLLGVVAVVDDDVGTADAQPHAVIREGAEVVRSAHGDVEVTGLGDFGYFERCAADVSERAVATDDVVIILDSFEHLGTSLLARYIAHAKEQAELEKDRCKKRVSAVRMECPIRH
jgi:hypothetical protein